MGMGIEDGGETALGLQRAGQEAAHLDIAQAQAQGFDGIGAVLDHMGGDKLHPWFVEADQFDGLLVDYARAKQANVIVRGLRGISDFEYELQMAMMNRHLDASVETVFMMPAEQYTYVSSRLIKEVMALGGGITGLVPPGVEQRLGEMKKGRSGK